MNTHIITLPATHMRALLLRDLVYVKTKGCVILTWSVHSGGIVRLQVQSSELAFCGGSGEEERTALGPEGLSCEAVRLRYGVNI